MDRSTRWIFHLSCFPYIWASGKGRGNRGIEVDKGLFLLKSERQTLFLYGGNLKMRLRGEVRKQLGVQANQQPNEEEEVTR